MNAAFKKIMGLGIKAFAADAEPEELAAAAREVGNFDDPEEGEKSHAQDFRRVDDYRWKDGHRVGDRRRAEDRRARLHRALDRVIDFCEHRAADVGHYRIDEEPEERAREIEALRFHPDDLDEDLREAVEDRLASRSRGRAADFAGMTRADQVRRLNEMYGDAKQHAQQRASRR